jgi:hypothetical protein
MHPFYLPKTKPQYPSIQPLLTPHAMSTSHYYTTHCPMQTHASSPLIFLLKEGAVQLANLSSLQGTLDCNLLQQKPDFSKTRTINAQFGFEFNSPLPFPMQRAIHVFNL